MKNVEDNNLEKYSSSLPYDMPCPKWITNWGLKCKYKTSKLIFKKSCHFGRFF